jgi:O-antigen/teichoic acid export membrane protein
VLVIAIAFALAWRGRAPDATEMLWSMSIGLGGIVALQAISWARRLLASYRASGSAGSRQLDWRSWRHQSLLLWVSSIGSATMQHADVVLVGLLLGETQAGIYAAASRTTQLLQLVPTALTAVLIPQISRTASEEGVLGLRKIVLVHNRIVFAPVVLAGLVILAAPQLALALFGPKFVDAILPLQILTVGHVSAALCGPLAPICVGAGWQRAYAVATTSSVAILGLLQLLLAPELGLVGAALATATANALPALALRYHLRRKVGIDTSALRDRRASGAR